MKNEVLTISDIIIVHFIACFKELTWIVIQRSITLVTFKPKGNDKLYLRRQSDQIAIFGHTERRLEDNWSMRTTAFTLTSTAATLSDWRGTFTCV